MTKERTSVKPKRITHRKSRKGRSLSTKQESLESESAILQHQIGNRAVQQAIVQREAKASSGFNPLDPKVIGAAAQAAISASETPVRNWLGTNISRLRLLTMDELVAQVRRNVTEASRLGDVEIQKLVRECAAAQNITILTVPGPSAGQGLSIQLPDAVKKAFSIPVDGVNVVPLPGGRLNISAKGATAKLKRGDIKLSWTGSLGIDIPMERFQLAGTVDRDRWELTLSVPGESSVPDLSKLADVFQKAEMAMRGMVEASSGFKNLNDIPKVTKTISPHVKPVKDAVDALVQTAKSPSVSAGVKLEGPMSGAGTQPGSSAGITVTATVTIRF
jgi:hypothetical protein